MQPIPPLPPALRLRKSFQPQEIWYQINSQVGLIEITVTDTSREAVIFKRPDGKTDTDSINSSLLLSVPEKIWLKKILIKAKEKKNSHGYYASIIADTYAGNLEAICFVNWLHRVQKKISTVVVPEVMRAVIERLLNKIME